MIISLHRWQPTAKRWRTEKHDTRDKEPILDFLFTDGAQNSYDPSVRQIVSRTQHVDRLMVTDGPDGAEVQVWLQPESERKYSRRKKIEAQLTSTNTIQRSLEKGVRCPTCHTVTFQVSTNDEVTCLKCHNKFDIAWEALGQ